MSHIFANCAQPKHLIFICFLLASMTVRADGVVTKLPTGLDPEAIAVNPVTNTLFVVNKGDDTVTVSDRNRLTTTSVPVGHLPVAIAINATTDQAYVVNSGSNSVTKIDGVTLATSSIAVGNQPNAIALDPELNRIFVANSADATITQIDGATQATNTIAVGNDPVALAVDPSGQKVVVVNHGANTVTIVDEGTLSTQTVGTGLQPSAVAVNAITSVAYVINSGDTTLNAISTVGNSESTVALVGHPSAIAINPFLGQYYVGFSDTGVVQVFDSLFGTFRNVQFNAPLSAIAADTSTGRVYAASATNHSVSVLDQETDTNYIVATAEAPIAIATDSLTNSAYCVESTANDVIQIDGSTYVHAATLGSWGLSFAINPVANEIYSADYWNVSVIDGETLSVRQLPLLTSTSLQALAVNPVNHKLYVAGSNVVVDLDSDTTTGLGATGGSIVVNPQTGNAYLLDSSGRKVSVIDSDANVITSLPVGNNPYSLAVDTVENKVFISNEFDSTLTVVDGKTNTASTVTISGFPISASPAAMAFDSGTSKLYVGSMNGLYTVDTVSLAVTNTGIECSNTLLALNPLTETFYCLGTNGLLVIKNGAVQDTIPVGNNPTSIVVDPVLNKIYLTNYWSEDVEVIDGATNAFDFIYLGQTLYTSAVNPITQQVFVGENSSAVGVLSPASRADNSLVVTISPFSQNVTADPNASLSSQVQTQSFAAAGYQAHRVYYQFDTKMGEWIEANGGPGAGPYRIPLSGLRSGTHILFAYATDGQDVSSVATGNVSAPALGAITAYAFTLMPDEVFEDGFE
jgi:YVTN family beta-propeller protein